MQFGIRLGVEVVKIAGIGHSHIICIQQAAESIRGQLTQNGIVFEALWIGEQRFDPYRKALPEGGVDGYGLVEELSSEILRVTDGADLVFSCIGGRAHNAFGLVNHPHPFDFELEEKSGLPLLQDRQVIPSAIVRAALERQGNYTSSQWWFRVIASLIGGWHVHCESPPPIPSVRHLTAYPGSFREMIEAHGVAPATLRYKLWRLHSSLFQEFCQTQGVEFLEVPLAALDAEGFLPEKSWNKDPTHANANYGRFVIEQLVRLKDPSFKLSEAA